MMSVTQNLFSRFKEGCGRVTFSRRKSRRKQRSRCHNVDLVVEISFLVTKVFQGSYQNSTALIRRLESRHGLIQLIMKFEEELKIFKFIR